MQGEEIFSINVCSQCRRPFDRSVTRDSRHAVPCGHVLCKDCVGRVEAEEKSGTSVCRQPGCGKKFGPSAEFAVAWCDKRVERIKAELEARFRDQGDAGACPEASRTPAHEEAVPAPNLCEQHQLPFQAVEASTDRPVCAECLTAVEGKAALQTIDEASAALEASSLAVSAQAAKQIAALAEPIFTPEGLCGFIAKWGSEETARIRAWEEREVKLVQAVAGEMVQHVQDACKRRIEVGASLITQRAGLRASLEELDQALADLPRDPAARLKRALAAHRERKQLCALLAGRKIVVPSQQKIFLWAEPQALSLDQEGADLGAVLVRGVAAAVKFTLDSGRSEMVLGENVHALPVIPKLVRFPFHAERVCIAIRCLPCSQFPEKCVSHPTHPCCFFPSLDRTQDASKVCSIPVGNKPNELVALDDNTVVIAFDGRLPLQVWDVATGRLVRQFEGKGAFCYSMISLPGGRVSASWHTSLHYVVAIFDVATGRQLQELNADYCVGQAFVEDHLLTVCDDRTVRAWGQDSVGKVRHPCVRPCGKRNRGWMGRGADACVAPSSLRSCSPTASQPFNSSISTLMSPQFTDKSRFTTAGRPSGAVTVISPRLVAISMSDPAQIEIWDWNEGKQVMLLAGFIAETVHALLPDGRLVVGDAAGPIRIGFMHDWAASTSLDESSSGVIGVRAGPDGSFVTINSAGLIKLWRNGACEATLAGASTTVHPGGTALAVLDRRLVVVGDNNLLVAE